MIWLLAIGYMAFYAPYSGMVKLLSSRVLLSEQQAVPRFAILPIMLVATVILVALVITALGWSNYVLSMAAVINLLACLGGYCIRLEAISRLAKSLDGSASRRLIRAME